MGGEPGRWGLDPAAFHERAAERADRWPASMTSLSMEMLRRAKAAETRDGMRDFGNLATKLGNRTNLASALIGLGSVLASSVWFVSSAAGEPAAGD